MINNVPRTRPTGGVNHTEEYKLRYEREPPTETKGRCVLWQPMDTSSVLYTATKRNERTKERKKDPSGAGESEGRRTTSEENAALKSKETASKRALFSPGRESESKCSLEGGSRWSDWSSALPSVGYLGAVQPLLGATPVPGGGEGLMWLPACQAASTIYNVYALAT